MGRRLHGFYSGWHGIKMLAVCLAICVLPFAKGQQTTPDHTPESKQGKSAIPANEDMQPTCAKLNGLRLRYASITSAAVVPAGPFTVPLQSGAAPPAKATVLPALPAFCRVQGTFRPTKDSEIRFEVWMPVSGWNGKFEQFGSGGFSGAIIYGSMADGLRSGYATASTDNGHEATSPIDASWALGHPEKVIDYGYRADHETNAGAKAFIRAFYGRAPSYSYFSGCSDGGREALMEAQRFPKDFNGILVGAPANFFTHLLAGFVWDEQALLSTPGSYIPVSKLPAIQAASLAACDASDGVKDGILEDPQNCHFDPAVLECKGQNGTDCLTAPQVEAARKIYAGPHNPDTGKLIFPGYEPGAEANPWTWGPWIIGKGTSDTSIQSMFGKQFFANMVFENPKWDFHTFDLVRDTKAADAKLGPIINATNPDLRPFKARGGKLIQFHGWADPAIAPLSSVHYYESVVEEMGGLERTQDFYRLFMAPGMGHCGGGPGPDSLSDVFNALVQWVEHGDAPAKIVATKFVDDNPQKAILETRPLCPYPQRAKYKGAGSTNDAANFVCESDGNEYR